MFRKLRQLTSNNKEEEGYRQFRLPNDKMQARLGVLLLVIPIISFVFNDYFLFQQSWLFVILAVLRFSLVAVSFGVFVLIGKAKTYQLFDKIVTLCVFGLMVGGAIINLTRPQNFIVQVILSCVCVFIIY
jgi:hypothetical protein